jgi:hypothetical protein
LNRFTYEAARLRPCIPDNNLTFDKGAINHLLEVYDLGLIAAAILNGQNPSRQARVGNKTIFYFADTPQFRELQTSYDLGTLTVSAKLYSTVARSLAKAARREAQA